MEKAFVFGKSVEGVNFTDRVEETKRLKINFENGINVILVSPRRMGKSSIVKKVKAEIANPEIKIVYMDIYDCRSEYDFYNRFASVLMKETATKSEQIIENIKRFLIRLTPKISFSPEPLSDISLSLGITPHQLNFIRAVCNGVHSDFGSKAVLESYNLGSKSNVSRIMNALRD